jgi:hypothetical protein
MILRKQAGQQHWLGYPWQEKKRGDHGQRRKQHLRGRLAHRRRLILARKARRKRDRQGYIRQV